MSDIESIRGWLRTCPVINENSPFMVDYLDDDPKCYAIYSSPSQIEYKRDILGNVYPSSVQTKTYYFQVSLAASESASIMTGNLEALNSMIEWMQLQNMEKNLPEIPGSRVLSLVPTMTPYAMQPNSNSMLYRITMQMTYRKES